MSMQFRDIAVQAAADGAITADEILSLRRAGWGDGRITAEEADAIFAVNDAVAQPTNDWSDFFVEAIGEFVVNGQAPKGYVTPEQGDWLKARIDNNGRVDSLTELELLVRVFEKATSVPEALRAYALEQVERAVLTGEGPTRRGGTLEKGNVTQAEADVVRRVLFSSGSERPAGISRREAELLFRIKDATVDAVNAPEWKRLFVQGVGNYLQGFTIHTDVSRERAAELEAFMADTHSSLGGFMGRMAKSAVHADGFRKVFGRKQPARDVAAEVAAERVVTSDEQAWLDGRIAENGRVDAYDEALLAFLAEG